MIVHNPNNLPTLPISDLLPTQGDLKDLTEKNYAKLKGVIERRGFSYPVYVWEDDEQKKHLLDGHQRQRVLNKEGWNEPIPYLKVPADSLQEAMARLLEITSQYATITQEGIDEFIATHELNEAEVYEATSFDALTNYGQDDEPEVEEDEAPEVSSEPPESQLGVVYQLGRHRVMCGDSTDKASVELLMNGIKADMVFTDPPYGMDFTGSVNGDGTPSANSKLQQIGNETGSELDKIEFIEKWLPAVLGLTDKAWYICCSRHNLRNLLNAFAEVKTPIRQIIIWNKNRQNVSNSDYKSKYELILYGWSKRSFYGSAGDNDVWEIDKENKNELHPTQKPISLFAKAISNSSKKGEIVADLFCGSGGTLIACEQTDRICYGMELDPKYVDVIRKRYAKFTNDNELPDNWAELTKAVE
jgi:DNA modification methylase